MTTLKTFFDTEFADVKFDRKFCERVIRFANYFVNKNEDHTSFFGSVLIGVNPIYFTDRDMEAWFDDVLEVDEDLLRARFKQVEYIDHENHIVASDVFNHIPAYICYRLRKQKDIPMNIKHDAMVSAFMILNYKYLTSLFYKRFKYPAKREVAEAAFMSLDYRFDIKKYGSWLALFRARGEDMVRADSVYSPFLDRFDDDYWGVRIVTDTQGRIRELINKYYSVYINTLNAGERVISTSMTAVTGDGEMMLKDKVTGYASYMTYIHEVVNHEQSFIKPELVDLVIQAMPTMQPSMLTESLKYISRNFEQPRAAFIKQFLDESVLYTFDFLQTQRSSLRNNTNLTNVIVKVKALLMSAKTDDPRIMAIREIGEKIAREATPIRSAASLAACRTGLMLYILLRTMTKNYYS